MNYSQSWKTGIQKLGSRMTEENIMTTAVAPHTGRVDMTSSFIASLLQKLRLEWSSCEFGGLLTPSKLAEARASFPHLETPIKVII